MLACNQLGERNDGGNGRRASRGLVSEVNPSGLFPQLSGGGQGPEPPCRPRAKSVQAVTDAEMVQIPNKDTALGKCPTADDPLSKRRGGSSSTDLLPGLRRHMVSKCELSLNLRLGIGAVSKILKGQQEKAF